MSKSGKRPARAHAATPAPSSDGQHQVHISAQGGRQFAHGSERQFAELLDFYRVRWEYEPVEFTLTWHLDGRVRSAIRPDFFLADFGCYVELTTLDQRLVTKKHAKLRLLRELYPGVEVKLLYRRDYRALIAKYGLTSAVPAASSAA